MISLEDAKNALDKLTFEELGQAERIRVGQILLDYIDHVGAENTALDMAHRYQVDESARHSVAASQMDDELRTLRGVADQCKGEVLELTDAAKRLCDLLACRPMSVDEADAVANLRTAMNGKQAYAYLARLKDSVRKFEALTIVRRMLRKLRVTDDVRSAADTWAAKQLRL